MRTLKVVALFLMTVAIVIMTFASTELLDTPMTRAAWTAVEWMYTAVSYC